MRQVMALAVGILCLLVIAGVRGGIPEPDAVFYGEVRINGILQTSLTPIWVRGRADVDRPPAGPGPEDTANQIVASYRMGANHEAGDRYVLRAKLESLADGSIQSVDAAVVRQKMRITVQRDGGPEMEGAVFIINEPGMIVSCNLPFAPNVDGDQSGKLDLRDFAHFQNCFSGASASVPAGGCGAADLNGDQRVNLDDYYSLQSQWIRFDLRDFARFQRCFAGESSGQIHGDCLWADFNADGRASLADYSWMSGRWGRPAF